MQRYTEELQANQGNAMFIKQQFPESLIQKILSLKFECNPDIIKISGFLRTISENFNLITGL